MPTIKKRDLFEIAEALNTLSKRNLPMSAAMDLKNVHRQIKGHLEDIDGVREERLKALAERNDKGEPKIVSTDNGSRYDLSPEAEKQFNEEFDELLKEEIEVHATVNVANFYPKKRDASGKVYREEPDVPWPALSQLGDLLVGETPEVEDTPQK